MKRQQWGVRSIGAIVRIKVADYYCFAQLITEDAIAFFDYQSKTPDIDIEVLKEADVLFILCVYNDIISNGRWEKISKMPLRENLKILPYQFLHDRLKSIDRGYELYNPNSGEIIPCTVEETRGLERCAVWDYGDVEERLECHYNGTACDCLKFMYNDTIWAIK